MSNSRLSQYVKQETQTQTDNGKEARATRLITERASRRIGQMAFEIAQARPRKVGLPISVVHRTLMKNAFFPSS
jgi:homoisocitrate dehydrogenase